MDFVISLIIYAIVGAAAGSLIGLFLKRAKKKDENIKDKFKQ